MQRHSEFCELCEQIRQEFGEQVLLKLWNFVIEQEPNENERPMRLRILRMAYKCYACGYNSKTNN